MSSLSSRCVIPLRTWSPFPLSASHLRFQVREKSRTSKPRPTSRPSEWPSHSPWCAIPFAPRVRFHCRSVTCASRCERRVAPRSPAPHPDSLSGHPTLPGARFPSHLESVPAVGQSLALPGAREESHHGAPPHVPVLRVAFPFFQVRDSLRTWSPFPLSASHLRFQVREKSRTSEPHPASQSSVWPSLSSRCVIPLRTWSPFTLSASHLRFQVREKSRTSKPHPASQSSVWPSLSSRCVIPLRTWSLKWRIFNDLQFQV